MVSIPLYNNTSSWTWCL